MNVLDVAIDLESVIGFSELIVLDIIGIIANLASTKCMFLELISY